MPGEVHTPYLAGSITRSGKCVCKRYVEQDHDCCLMSSYSLITLSSDYSLQQPFDNPAGIVVIGIHALFQAAQMLVAHVAVSSNASLEGSHFRPVLCFLVLLPCGSAIHHHEFRAPLHSYGTALMLRKDRLRPIAAADAVVSVMLGPACLLPVSLIIVARGLNSESPQSTALMHCQQYMTT